MEFPCGWCTRPSGSVTKGRRRRTALTAPPTQVLADNIVGTAAERAHRRNPDVKVSTEVVPEEAVTALLREGHNAFAVVTGSRGRGDSPVCCSAR